MTPPHVRRSNAEGSNSSACDQGAIHAGNNAEKGKPDPDIFLAALERLDYPPRQDLVVVGDTPYDVETAGKAGLRTIGVLCGGFSEQSLCSSGCIALYRDPADFLAHLD